MVTVKQIKEELEEKIKKAEQDGRTRDLYTLRNELWNWEQEDENLEFTRIYVNGKRMGVTQKEYTGGDMVAFAFGKYCNTSSRTYTITSTNKDSKNLKSYSLSDNIKIEKDMRVNVDITNNA